MSRKIKIPASQIRALFEPKSFDAEKNTIEVVFSTGARGKRWTWDGGTFHEELSMKKAHIRMERLALGAPLLNAHQGYKMENVLGRTVSARIEDGQGIAVVQLATRPEVAGLIQDIRAGVFNNISVGYEVHKFRELKEKAEDGAPILRAEDWEPLEISIVPMPFDMHSQVRSRAGAKEEDAREVEVEQTEGEEMKRKAKVEDAKKPAAKTAAQPATRAKKAAPAPVVAEDEAEGEDAEEGEDLEDAEIDASEDDAEGEEGEVSEDDSEDEGELEGEDAPETEAQARSIQDGRARENARQKEIRTNVRLAGLPAEFGDELCNKATLTVEQARAKIIRELGKRTENKTKNNRIEVDGMGLREARRAAAVRGILDFAGVGKSELKSEDREYRNIAGSVIQLARHVLAQEGVRNAHTMSGSEVAKRALHTSSDFAGILADASNKSLRDGYQGVPSTYQLFTRTKNVKDFKTINSYNLGNGGRLDEVLEHGEYKRTSLNESKESYKLTKYGFILGRTFELMVNDDMDAFSRIPQSLGVRAREKENQVFWKMIVSNPLMSDGNAFFSAAHGNLGSAGAAIGEAPVSEARRAMRTQLDLEGELTSVSPKYLVVPAAKETAAQKFNTSILAHATADVNVFAGSLIPVVEPLLDAASGLDYYFGADKSQMPIAEMSLLDGKGPEIFTREGFEIDGMEMKLRYIFGMGLLEYRGFRKQIGA